MTAIWLMAGMLAGVDPALLSSLCFAESTHNASAYRQNDGSSPSYGLCQIKESTARDMGFTGHRSFLMKPEINAYYAAKYLAFQKKRFGSWERAVSAYNCGKPCSNKGYVAKVMRGWGKHGPDEKRAQAVARL